MVNFNLQHPTSKTRHYERSNYFGASQRRILHSDVRKKMSEFFTENSDKTMREFRKKYEVLSDKQGKSLSLK